MREKNGYSVNEVAAICDVSVKSLHYYEEIRFIIPEIKRENSTKKYYSKDQMETIFMVKRFRALGFSLKEIREIIEKDTVDFLEDCISVKLDTVEKKLKKLNDIYAEGRSLLVQLHKGREILGQYEENKLNSMRKMNLCSVMVERQAAINVYGFRQTMSFYHNEETSLDQWIKVDLESREKGYTICGPVIVTYHTDPMEQFWAKDCDMEFCIQIEENQDSDERTGVFGDFLAATLLHIGAYENIINSHMKIMKWITDNHYKVVGPVSEQFIISPVDIKNKEEHVIKIIVPIGK